MFVIYHKETTKQHYVKTKHVRCYKEDWATEGAAKAARTRAKLDPTVWLIADAIYFRECIELQETRKDAMNGKAFTTGVNAPFSTCRSSENYYCS